MKRLLWVQFKKAEEQEGIQDLKRAGFKVLGRRLRITWPAIGWWWNMEAPEEIPNIFTANGGAMSEFVWKG